MSDAFDSLDYGEQLVIRYRASGRTRKEFAEQAGISVSTLDYYVRRERRASMPADFTPNSILPVDLVASGEEPCGVDAAPAFAGGIAIRLANGRVVEVERGFDYPAVGQADHKAARELEGRARSGILVGGNKVNGKNAIQWKPAGKEALRSRRT